MHSSDMILRFHCHISCCSNRRPDMHACTRHSDPYALQLKTKQVHDLLLRATHGLLRRVGASDSWHTHCALTINATDAMKHCLLQEITSTGATDPASLSDTKRDRTTIDRLHKKCYPLLHRVQFWQLLVQRLLGLNDGLIQHGVFVTIDLATTFHAPSHCPFFSPSAVSSRRCALTAS